MQSRNGTGHAACNEVCELHHLRRIHRIDEVFAVEIAVTKMESELDVRWHARGETPKVVGEYMLLVIELSLLVV